MSLGSKIYICILRHRALLGFMVLFAAALVSGLVFLAYVGRCWSVESVEIERDVNLYPATLATWRATGLVGHFPTTIPAEAKEVRYAAFPGMLQGGPWIQLHVRLPRLQVVRLLEKARQNAVNAYGHRDPSMPRVPTTQSVGGFGTLYYTAPKSIEINFPDSFTVYPYPPISRNGFVDPEESHGMAISGATNEVVFWAN